MGIKHHAECQDDGRSAVTLLGSFKSQNQQILLFFSILFTTGGNFNAALGVTFISKHSLDFSDLVMSEPINLPAGFRCK